MQFSKFGEKFTQQAGILTLMEDLGHALTVNKEMLMLGGGNPGRVPAVESLIQIRLKQIADNPEAVHRLVGIYDPPQGNVALIRALIRFFRNLYGWPVREENICLTNGSQSAFYMLFNLLAGEYADGSFKTIHFPLTPEYIGYADVGVQPHIFEASRPKIEWLGAPFFKYHIDFENLIFTQNTAALCVSRPTNPTGNVLTDDEIEKLDEIARASGVPLMIDNAYGVPFPGIIYKDASPFWNEHVILCMSLSKLGLPSVRTGIVIGPTDIVQALARMNAIFLLAPTGVGSQLVLDLVESGEIRRISNELVRPFYEQKMMRAVEWLNHSLDGVKYGIHHPEGAMFLWVWFPDLPVHSSELYRRLKDKGVLVVSGHYFFPGLKEDWAHTGQCLRITYSQADSVVQKGIEIIGREVRALSTK